MLLTRIRKNLHHFFCKTKIGLWIAVTVGIATAISVGNNAHADSFENIAVEVKGTGPAIIFIPGLTSSSATFTETCDAFKHAYTCHLLHLPGFAGQLPDLVAQTQFLTSMRDSIHRYIDTQKLEQPLLVGHSLGGVLSLMLAVEHPELARQLVIIDALPFYPAIQNPALTTETTRPQAEQMRSYMQNLPEEEYRRNAAMQLAGMSNDPARMPLLTEWSKTSDRATTSQAIHDMMTTDLRGELHKIKTPTLVLGSWAAYKAMGATRQSTLAIFSSQYALLKGVEIRMSDTGFHFLTWDDPQWVNDEINRFITTGATAK
jgi:pimeloyl-ACP methyl ester carboxylesterase